MGESPFAALSKEGLPPGPSRVIPKPMHKNRGRVDIRRQTAHRGGKTVTTITREQIGQQPRLPGATRLANQAQVDAARLNLSYTKVTAPIAGRLGHGRHLLQAVSSAYHGAVLVIERVTQHGPAAVDLADAVVDLDSKGRERRCV